MRQYTVCLYLQTALHVSGGISTHHQELISLYLQYLTLLRPLLLPVVSSRSRQVAVEQFADINKLYIVASFSIIIDTYYAMHVPLNMKDSISFLTIIYTVNKTCAFHRPSQFLYGMLHNHHN